MDTLTREEAIDFLERSPVAHIGVISNGEPYVTPMSFVLDGNRILFRTKPGQRFDALREHPSVSIEVSSYNEETGDWISVIVQGEATMTDDHDLSTQAVHLLLQKYQTALGSPLSRGGLQPMAGFPHVVQVEIREITGLCSGRGIAARTRPGRL